MIRSSCQRGWPRCRSRRAMQQHGNPTTSSHVCVHGCIHVSAAQKVAVKRCSLRTSIRRARVGELSERMKKTSMEKISKEFLHQTQLFQTSPQDMTTAYFEHLTEHNGHNATRYTQIHTDTMRHVTRRSIHAYTRSSIQTCDLMIY